MSKKKTSSSKYFSKSAGGYVTAAQYITELICEALTRKKKPPLGAKFWKNPEWAKTYRNQIASANKLLSKFSVVSVISALKDERARSAYSLRSPYLLKLIKEYEKSQKDFSHEFHTNGNYPAGQLVKKLKWYIMHKL